jgi:uncharacterized protein YjbI with pentapeptide repeats
MKKFYTAALVVIMLLTMTGYASADGPVGADCTDPPNLVPFADLSNCDLSGRNMEGVDLSHANLSGANLDNASLFTTNLIGTIFDHASLRNTNLEDGYAPGASFIDADLRGAYLYFATLSDANLSGVNLSDTWLSFFSLARSNLQNADLSGSSLDGVDMQDTDLRGADLSLTVLLYVTLSNADLRNANLLGADRKVGTSLNGVIWGNTICADGSNSDDDDGDNFTCESNFPANQPPTVSLTSPANNTTVTKGAIVNLSANAADSDGSVIRVEFYAGNALLNMDVVVPYSFNWTTSVAGTYVLTAKAYDNDDAVTTSQPVTVTVLPSPNNTPPTVAITSPKNNATVYRFWGTTINVNANDPNGVITRVEFYVGSTLLNTDTFAPYSFYWKPSSTGNQTLTAKAYDDDGAVTTSAPVTVRVR